MTEPDNKTKQIEDDPMMSLTASGSKPPVYDMIGRRLREFYDDVAQQPVPDRFVELLKRLDANTSPKSKN